MTKEVFHYRVDKFRKGGSVTGLSRRLSYNLADAVSMVAMGVTVSGEAEVSIPDIDFFFFECFGFLVIAIFVWLYMLTAKKYVYNPFKVS